MTGKEKMEKILEELFGVVKRVYGPAITARMFDHFEEAYKQEIKEATEEEREACAKIAEERVNFPQTFKNKRRRHLTMYGIMGTSPMKYSDKDMELAAKWAQSIASDIRARSS